MRKFLRKYKFTFAKKCYILGNGHGKEPVNPGKTGDFAGILITG